MVKLSDIKHERKSVKLKIFDGVDKKVVGGVTQLNVAFGSNNKYKKESYILNLDGIHARCFSGWGFNESLGEDT